MKLDEGTSGLDTTTRLRAADLPRLPAHSGPEGDLADHVVSSVTLLSLQALYGWWGAGTR